MKLALVALIGCSEPADPPGETQETNETSVDTVETDVEETEETEAPEDTDPEETDLPVDTDIEEIPEDTDPPSSASCELPPITNNAVWVHDSTGLLNAIENATPFSEIVLESGTYDLPYALLWLDTEGLVIRGETGDPNDVILDGQYTDSGQMIWISASDVVLADLTVQHASNHLVHVAPWTATDVLGVRLLNLRLLDPGQQAIKINTDNISFPTYYVDGAEIGCSTLELTDAGRPYVTYINGGECYTGGIDAHATDELWVHDTTIEGFWCPTGANYPSEHAIHVWNGAGNTRIENNRLINNARGIGFGLGDGLYAISRTWPDTCPSANPPAHYHGQIVNNLILVNEPDLFVSEWGFDTGIGLEQACEPKVYHNVVFSTQAPESSSIEYRFSGTNAEIVNNLTTHNIRERNNGVAELVGNFTVDGSEFVSASDFHLLPNAFFLDQGDSRTAGSTDIDGETRGNAPDPGIDER